MCLAALTDEVVTHLLMAVISAEEVEKVQRKPLLRFTT
jgi:hypothetical protein